MKLPFELLIDVITQRLVFLRRPVSDINPKNIKNILPKIFINI